jgi:hypothetical protein
MATPNYAGIQQARNDKIKGSRSTPKYVFLHTDDEFFEYPAFALTSRYARPLFPYFLALPRGLAYVVGST